MSGINVKLDSLHRVMGGACFSMYMTIRILDIDEKDWEVSLIKRESDGKIIWETEEKEYTGPDYRLSFILDERGRKVSDILKGNNIIDSTDELKHRFEELLFEENISKAIQEEDGFDNADESENDNTEKYNPYNPKLIRVDTKTFSIGQINQMILDKEIDLSPDFQRGFVWTDITRKSRLIESLLLRIPLPVFYFAQDEEGLFQVVDGVQRLTVIKSFLNNEFKLKNLEYLSECEGKWYKNPSFSKEQSLSGMYARRIEQTQLYINIIDPQTPAKVKYDIFKRINTGGKALNRQEIRNCLSNSRTREFLHSLAGSDEFLKATRGSVSPVRMADEELILRFIAFYLIDTERSTVKEYRGGMDELLDETVNILNSSDLMLLKNVRGGFTNAMVNAYKLFGNEAFRKSRYINKALFLGLSRVLCWYRPDQMEHVDRQALKAGLEAAIRADQSFSSALSMATNDARNVNRVYSKIKEILEKNCNE